VSGPLKRVAWLGDSRERVRFFPSLARREAGLELQSVQEGKDPSDRKPMPIVGPGVKEIPVHTEGSPAAIALARSRYKEVLQRESQKV